MASSQTNHNNDVEATTTSNAQQEQYQQKISLLDENDLSLRPPLPVRVQENHDQEIRSLLCRMFVASNTLRIGSETRFTALVLLHRFHAALSSTTEQGTRKDDNNASEEKPNKGLAAATCLFLACKAEEEPRRLRDIINVAHMIFQEEQPSETNTNINNEDKPQLKEECNSSQSTADTLTLYVQREPPPLNAKYWETKEKLVFNEQVVLRWLGFDVSVSRPHRMVALLVKEVPLLLEILQKWNVQPDQIVPVAWRRINDSVFYAKALQHSVLEMACASIELALEEMSQELKTCSKSCPWWHTLGVRDESVAQAKQHVYIASESLRTKG